MSHDDEPEYDIGVFFEDPDDEDSGNTYHFIGRAFSKHNEATNTDYDEVPYYHWKRWYIDCHFAEKPDAKYGTDEEGDEVNYYVEPRDGSRNDIRCTNPEPDPNDQGSEFAVAFSLAVGVGPLSSSISWSPGGFSYTDTYRDNYSWLHWSIPYLGLPDSYEHAPGVAWDVECRSSDGTVETIACWTNFTWTYVDPGTSLPAYVKTDTVGGFADFTVEADY